MEQVPVLLSSKTPRWSVNIRIMLRVNFNRVIREILALPVVHSKVVRPKLPYGTEPSVA